MSVFGKSTVLITNARYECENGIGCNRALPYYKQLQEFLIVIR